MSARFIIALAAFGLASGCANCGGGPGGPDAGPDGGGDNTPPAAQILEPLDGATVEAGLVTLRGTATDVEDGTLTGASLAWSSNLDGALGTGTELQATLSAGVHLLKLEATDSGGAKGSATVSVTATAVANRPPVPVIDSPANGAQIDEGQPIDFVGHATDPEDGAITGASLAWSSNVSGAIGSGGTVRQQIPPLGTQQIMLSATDSAGLTGYATISVTVVPVGANHAPIVSITSPANGAALVAGQAVTFVGSAADQEDGALSGASVWWWSSADGSLGTGTSLTTSALSTGVHTITFTAMDSAFASASASISVTVNAAGNQPPVAAIDAPASGASFPSGAAVTLLGHATDPEDGALSGTSLAWSSDRDGSLGSGSPLVTSSLTPGAHRLSLVATDSHGASGVATVSITVLAANSAPTVSVTSPPAGAHFAKGTAVPLRGEASDPEDGALSGTRLTWRSSLDGVLGTGASLDVASLREGSHQLTLTATDSGGLTASASVDIVIDPAPVNLPPIARLTGPASGEARAALTFDGSSSGDSDGTIASYAFDFGDGTAVVVGAASAATHTFAAAGSFTVTLTVTDDKGATSSAELTVAISPYVRRPVVVASGHDWLGSLCALGLEADGTPQIAFRDDTHPSLWLATQSGGTWQTELVDGMGFGVGGRVGTSAALAVDGTGQPHLAYSLGGSGVWYATRVSGSWSRERVDSGAVASPTTRVALALDGFRSGRPTVAYTIDDAYYSSGWGQYFARPGVAFRTAPASWTAEAQQLGTTPNDLAFAGGLAFLADGTALFGFMSNVGLGRWIPGAAPEQFTFGAAGADEEISLGLAGHALVLSGANLYDVTLPLPTATASTSPYEPSEPSHAALAVDGSSQPWIAVNHGGTLEVLTPDGRGYFTRTTHGPMDATQFDLAIDAAGEPRVCFFRGGKLMLF